MSTATTTTTANETEHIPSGDTTATLNFYAPPADGSRPYNRVSPPPTPHTTNVLTVAHEVPIHDLRSSGITPSLSTHGFEIHPHHTSLAHANFLSESHIEMHYYPEVRALIKEHIPEAKEIVIFDHTVRGTGSREPAQRVHIDQTPWSAAQRLRNHLGDDDAEELLENGTRFQIVNVWRPTNGPVVAHLLALADSQSIREDELVGIAHIYPKYVGETAGVKWGAGQKWWYLSGHTTEEVLLIKCYDSLIGEGGQRRRAPHTAFAHPDTKKDAKARESIEVRCLLIGE